MSGFELTGQPAGPKWLTRARLSRPLALAAGLVAGAALGLLVVALLSMRLLGFQALTVASDSMAPALKTGDLIIVKPVNIGSVDPGDVVLFASGGERIPTVHRVLGVNEYETLIRDGAEGKPTRFMDYGLVTGGDANPAPDAREVSAEQLMGTVWFTVPGGGALAGLPINTAFLGLAIAVVAVWMVWEIRSRRERRGRAHIGALMAAGALTFAAASGVSLSNAVAWTAPAGSERGAAMVVQLETRPVAKPAEDQRPIESEPADPVETIPVAEPTTVGSKVETFSDDAPNSGTSEPDSEVHGPETTPVAERPGLPGERQPPNRELPTREPPRTERQESPPARR